MSVREQVKIFFSNGQHYFPRFSAGVGTTVLQQPVSGYKENNAGSKIEFTVMTSLTDTFSTTVVYLTLHTFSLFPSLFLAF